MRLVKVDHSRCAEWAGTTYLWVPDNLTDPEFRAAVFRAKDKYLKTWDEWTKAGPEPAHPGGSISINTRKPELYAGHETVADLIHEYNQKVTAYAEWNKLRHDATQNFGYWLKLEIPGAKWLHEEKIPQANIDWGHRHGQRLELTFTNTHDLSEATRGFSIDSGLADDLF